MSKNGLETHLKIFLAILDADKPLRMSEIEEATGISSAHLAKCLPKAIEEGLLVPFDVEDGKDKYRCYGLQRVFADDFIFNKFLSSIAPIARQVGMNVTYEFTKKKRVEVIRNNMIAFLSAVSRKAANQ